MIEIVSILLQEFYENSPHETIITTSKILLKLIHNASSSKQAEGDNKDYGTIKLSNPKIQTHIVNVTGALDILGAVGFQRASLGNDASEQVLKYSPWQTNNNSDSQDDERKALIEAICNGLEMKITELSPPPSAAAATATSAPATSNNEFLSTKERQLRLQKIKETKKAERKAREITKQRWKEDAEERKLASQRKELALQKMSSDEYMKRVIDEGGDGLLDQQNNLRIGKVGNTRGGDMKKKSSAVVLPKPFEDNTSSCNGNDEVVRRELIQQTMKDEKLSPKEKQAKIQELMRANGNALLGMKKNDVHKAVAGVELAASNVSETAASAASSEKIGLPKDDDTTTGELKKPAPDAMESTMKALPKNMITPPSSEWKEFIQHTPRCSGAENIRATSVFYNRHGGGSGDLAAPRCLKRLFKELDGLKDDLPSDPNCSIWLRFDEETPQYIRALITAPLPGPTPYSGGVFAFDIYIPNDYPNTNPKVQLLTTGGGRVRFGPNLYADGKVCLSLLGTWDGPRWNPKHSSLYQVLISIQSLILGVEHPYYLEPGHGGWEGQVKDGDFMLTGHTLSGQSVKQEVGVPLEVVLYEDVLRVGTVKHAIIQPIKTSLEKSALMSSVHGMEAFSEIICSHFYENRTAVLTEIRSWMSDDVLGRNRGKASEVIERRSKLGPQLDGGKTTSEVGTKLHIDALQPLFPKLEDLLSKVSMPQSSDSVLDTANDEAAKPNDTNMEIEEQLKPAAKVEVKNPYAKTKKKKNTVAAAAASANNESKQTTASATSGGDIVEERRQLMQQAAANGDYILAGKLQGEVKRLEELQTAMKEAANQNNFIRAGKLQIQFNALASVGNKQSAAQHHSAPSSSAWKDESSDEDSQSGSDEEESHGEDEMDWDDDGFGDGGMGSMGPPPFAGGGMGGPPFNAGGGMQGHHQPPFNHPGQPNASYKNMMMSKQHQTKWGKGHALGDTSSPAKALSSTEGDSKMAAVPQQTIPPDQLCRLRIRLPQDKSVIEDFNKNQSLSEVYRRLEHLVSDQNDKKSTVAGPLVAGGGGAFSQPLSSAGFTLLLTRPKREFSLEMHATKSLDSLNLAPSATLTVMKCNERGVAIRGEVESRLGAAQGDAMDVDGLTYEGLMELTERVGNAGPKEGSAFLTLTAEEFEEHTEKISTSAYFEELESEEEDCGCPICLGAYDNSQDNNTPLRKVNSCGHVMHESCLQTWLATNSACPLCKTHIIMEIGSKKKSS